MKEQRERANREGNVMLHTVHSVKYCSELTLASVMPDTEGTM
jgi:hypothetical protein